MKREVLIIGLGLIGGSIALGIRKEHDVRMVGFDINDEQMRMAVSLGIVDEKATSLREAVQSADLIVLSVPVAASERLLDEMKAFTFKPGAIMTDVGSTKQQICEKATELSDKVVFVGGHPMAGSHKSGVSAAKVHLFENAFYVFTPSSELAPEVMSTLKDWLKGTRATFLEMTASEHDEITGAISHFPHIIAASLVHHVESEENRDTNVTRLAAGGFRDITRIASSSPEMWRDILLHNQPSLLRLLDEWDREMQHVRTLLETKDRDGIFDYFQRAKDFREKLPERKKGAIPAFYDLFVDVPDHPGAISDVTGILADAKISLTNIRILETREDIMGVLRLSFRSEEDREQAKEQLGYHTFESYI
ncbi:prephenate dehydrogenase [Alkalicoccobacillus murimartini]|jgi:prephenate dehydrogenase|uniref:Prephenate dehydrogenase n=1 Tax=Alkalicoccobacillus murimartini TaxID=171685 RepID=A0ABT9YDY0_9BACI|nr:prephenate dehydrogenase [Alkalicoccobacillus murimartini]MDQ0205929.1 prephenate dehydrogenase [Alkalicoccobacillus murimartini]